MVADVPWPGARASTPVTVKIAPRPAAGSSHDQPGPPGEEQQGAADEQ